MSMSAASSEIQTLSLLGIARVHFYRNADVNNSPLSHLFNIHCVRKKKKTVDEVKVRNCF